ncbi:hypothetical protein H6G97_10785 [Nostoc flagelliforme FACHB-838]|uniref:CheR-type methyltransferase domain-containing protein n=1 Tax=Nostoc flagelliforme FACHB-838 TaxID=2692904 RepID=A0ABR8DKM9_9NOSO|nr:hypothetical protein [Nostoc flagelliforme]MBD2530027.1 hypothetical protein [Nostoc flagelliforme FACHB-838]
MDDIYNRIIAGICDRNRISSEVSLRQYLRHLQPHALKLWQSYRNDNVTVDYTDFDTQAAYLLRYYPLYAAMTRQIFEDLNQNILFSTQHIQACFFGAGPAPETVGLITYLEDNFPCLLSAQFKIYDIAADSWRHSRRITNNYLIKEYFLGLCKLNASPIDLLDINTFEPIEYDITNSMIFVFQNCLNEMGNDLNTFLKNIGFLVRKMPRRSILIIADQSNYRSSNRLMNRIESYILAMRQGNIMRSHTQGGITFQSRDLLPPIPVVIKKYLLTGEHGLIPRHSVDFNYLAFRKNAK